MNKYVTHYPTNEAGRDFIVGDLHGCYDEMQDLMEHVLFDINKDRLFSVGDLIDRGPKSVECLQMLDEPYFFAVKGNHEDMMYKALVRNSWEWQRIWMNNGGTWAFNLTFGKTLAEKYIEPLPLIITVGKGETRFNIVHAEIFEDGDVIGDWNIDNWKFKADNATMFERVMWGRDIVKAPLGFKKLHEGLSTTYCGHTPLRKWLKKFGHTFIDTGAVYTVMKPGTNTDCHLTMVEHAAKKVYKYFPHDKSVVEEYL